MHNEGNLFRRGLPDELHLRLLEPDGVKQVVRDIDIFVRLPHPHVAHHLLLLSDRGPGGESRKGPQGAGPYHNNYKFMHIIFCVCVPWYVM
jgi:hypothetical protein